MKVKAFTELLKKPTTDCIVGLVTPTELLYKWNMNKLDQNENS
jgi:tRNA uridine 5-carbamoylmethylation protein Kti12